MRPIGQEAEAMRDPAGCKVRADPRRHPVMMVSFRREEAVAVAMSRLMVLVKI